MTVFNLFLIQPAGRSRGQQRLPPADAAALSVPGGSGGPLQPAHQQRWLALDTRTGASGSPDARAARARGAHGAAEASARPSQPASPLSLGRLPSDRVGRLLRRRDAPQGAPGGRLQVRGRRRSPLLLLGLAGYRSLGVVGKHECSCSYTPWLLV